MLVAVIGGLGLEDDLDVFDLRQVGGQAAARDRRAIAALTRLGVGPVDQSILGEGGAEDDVQQAALAARRDGGQAGDRSADLALGRDHPHPAGLLRHQPLTVGQQGQAPGMDQARGDGFVAQGSRGLDARRAGLAVEGRLLVRVIGGAGLDGGARGCGRILPIGPAGGGEDEKRGGRGEDDRTHEALQNSCMSPSRMKPRRSAREPKPSATDRPARFPCRSDLNPTEGGDIRTPLALAGRMTFREIP
ncbi:hypothetical protein D3C86_1503540 [compost metagenome]